jgi:hypothetical protein
MWPDENPHAIRSYQQQVSINLCTQILGDCFVGTHVLLACAGTVIALILFEDT